MGYSLEKINDYKINPIKVSKLKPDQILRYNMIWEIYANIFTVRRKNSSKSNLIKAIMEYCINKFTNIIVFCSTYNFDYN